MNPDMRLLVVEQVSGAWKFSIKPVVHEKKFTNKRFAAQGETFTMQCFKNEIEEIKPYFLERIYRDFATRMTIHQNETIALQLAIQKITEAFK